jgi:hypothetical protein
MDVIESIIMKPLPAAAFENALNLAVRQLVGGISEADLRRKNSSATARL